MQVNDTTAKKKELRRTCLAQRKALTGQEKAAFDAAICQSLAAHPYFLRADLLLCYKPFGSEPDLRPLFALAQKHGIPLAFPRCVGNEMIFLLASPDEVIYPDDRGILSPSPDARPATITPDTLCILPGLAAGLDGSRLGFGGGYYDRFLYRYKGKMLFPLYSFLVFPTLPKESFDIPLPILITEKGEMICHGKAQPAPPDLP